ncbi:MAG: GNAT family N-acetyltransferase [Prevotellaceae bacterium]|nr:GNAT family N-acetyltransferase [Prevotellaceae bacterium]
MEREELGHTTLRKATREDAPFLALCLTEAMGGKAMERQQGEGLTESDRRILSVLTSLSGRDDTLYSWRFGTIATRLDGTPIGASIAYPGEEYHQRRLVSFALAKDIITFDVAKMEDEALGGELYLDTLAVVPAHRRKGVAQALMRHWLLEARSRGLTATLLCAGDNGKALRLYESMGMRKAGEVFAFGQWYMKMAQTFETIL